MKSPKYNHLHTRLQARRDPQNVYFIAKKETSIPCPGYHPLTTRLASLQTPKEASPAGESDASANDRIKSRFYTHLRHVLRFSAPSFSLSLSLHSCFRPFLLTSGARPFASLIRRRGCGRDKARRTRCAPSSINCFEGTRRSRGTILARTKRTTGCDVCIRGLLYKILSRM